MSTPVMTPGDLRETYSFTFPASRDTYYASLIESATAACQRHLERDLRVSPFTDYHDGGSSAIVLDHTPVTAISMVTVAGILIHPEVYRVDKDAGVLILYQDVPQGRDVVVVEYTAGWEVIPGDVLWCVALTVQYMAKLMQSSQAGVVSRVTDGGTENLEQNLPPLAVQKHLSAYRRNRAR
jgi:hypothetical protein